MQCTLLASVAFRVLKLAVHTSQSEPIGTRSRTPRDRTDMGMFVGDQHYFVRLVGFSLIFISAEFSPNHLWKTLAYQVACFHPRRYIPRRLTGFAKLLVDVNTRSSSGVKAKYMMLLGDTGANRRLSSTFLLSLTPYLSFHRHVLAVYSKTALSFEWIWSKLPVLQDDEWPKRVEVWLIAKKWKFVYRSPCLRPGFDE